MKIHMKFIGIMLLFAMTSCQHSMGKQLEGEWTSTKVQGEIKTSTQNITLVIMEGYYGYAYTLRGKPSKPQGYLGMSAGGSLIRMDKTLHFKGGFLDVKENPRFFLDEDLLRLQFENSSVLFIRKGNISSDKKRKPKPIKQIDDDSEGDVELF